MKSGRIGSIIDEFGDSVLKGCGFELSEKQGKGIRSEPSSSKLSRELGMEAPEEIDDKAEELSIEVMELKGKLSKLEEGFNAERADRPSATRHSWKPLDFLQSQLHPQLILCLDPMSSSPLIFKPNPQLQFLCGL